MIALPRNHLNLVFTSLIIVMIVKPSNLDRIKTKIYKSLENKHNCFRRLNDTDQIGCNTKESGSVGIIHIINEDQDLDTVLKTGKNYPYVPVISMKYFNFETLIQMKSKSGRISGVLVVDKDLSKMDYELKSYSPDKSCPNDNFDLYVNNSSYSHCQKQKWNIVDNRNNDRIDENLMFNEWPFPIFLIRNQTNVTELQNCFQKYNKWPLCAVQLTASSYAAKDAKTCIRRSVLMNNPINILNPKQFCEPFQSNNMFSPLFITSKNVPISDKSVIILSARLDSFSMFSNLSPGADSVITSLVTFLSVVHTLSQTNIKGLIQKIAPERNVLFALFDGEAFDYIGSSRAVYDMNSGQFPVNPKDNKTVDVAQIRTKHFSHFIELNQLAPKGKDGQRQTLYIHKNLHSNSDLDQLQNIIKENAKYVPDLEFESTIDGAPLPPSSLQTFLKEDNSLIGIVIANHQKEYTNRLYNSIYDNFDKLDINETKLAKSLTNIATVISKTIFDLLTASSNLTQTNETNGSNISFEANEELTKSLLKCYLINTNCSLFNTVFKAENNPNVTFETYVGSDPMMSFFTYMLLSYFNGEKVDHYSEEDCRAATKERPDKRFSYNWIPGPTSTGLCIRSHSLLQQTHSPAFIGYKKGKIYNSSLYSTWTASLPKDTFVRIFVKASPLQEWLTLLSGIVILIISTSIITFLKIYYKKVFNLSEDESSVSTLNYKDSDNELDLDKDLKIA